MKYASLLTLLPIAFTGSLSGQSVEFLFADYNHAIYQTDASSSVPLKTQWPDVTDWGNYNFYTGISIGDPVQQIISNPKISGPSTDPGGTTIPWDGDGYELELYFDTGNDLTTDISAGAYTFSGSIASTSFSQNIVLGSFSKLTDRLLTNYTELQSFDPTQPVTIKWEEFTEGQGGLGGFIEIEVSYWDNGTYSVWNLENDYQGPLNDFDALDANVTEITIPANTLVGSPYDEYTVEIFFLRIDSLADATDPSLSGAQVATVTSMDLVTTIKPQVVNPPANPWDIFGVDQSGWTDTGDWLGQLNVNERPWVWSHNMQKYLYIPDGSVSMGGAWAYFPN
jgi:hypothetical protein